MQVVCMIWGNSKYYCNNDRMVHIFKLIHNMFIDQAKMNVDPQSIFQIEAIEALNKINLIIDLLVYYK